MAERAPRIALALVAVAMLAGFALVLPGAREEARGRKLTRTAGISETQLRAGIAALERSRRRRPDGALAPLLAGQYIRVGQAGRAVALLEPLVRAEPENLGAWSILALALRPFDPARADRARARARVLAARSVE